MLNEVNVKVRLVRNKDSFCLMSGEANASYKVKIISAVLLVRKVQLSPSVFLAHAKALKSGLAKYPIRRVVYKTCTIPAGNLDGSEEKLFIGQLPTRLVIGCVDAFNGSYTKNPYNIKNFALSEISIHLDGNAQPIRPLKPTTPAVSTSMHSLASFPEAAKKTGTKATTLRAKSTPKAKRCMHLTSVRISPKKDTLIWPSKGPCV